MFYNPAQSYAPKKRKPVWPKFRFQPSFTGIYPPHWPIKCLKIEFKICLPAIWQFLTMNESIEMSPFREWGIRVGPSNYDQVCQWLFTMMNTLLLRKEKNFSGSYTTLKLKGCHFWLKLVVIDPECEQIIENHKNKITYLWFRII